MYRGFYKAQVTAYDMEKKLLWAGGIGVLLFVTLGIISLAKHSYFFIDSLVGIAVILLAYRWRHNITSFDGILMLLVAALMNTAGVLGAYEIYMGPVGWDKMLHIVALVGVTLICYTYLQKHRFSVISAIVLTFFVAQGIGAFNEILEFLGFYFVGLGQGFFGMQNGVVVHAGFDLYDTHWDMVFNTIGITLGLLYAQIGRLNKHIHSNKPRKHSR
jgi:hypothetical protein